MDEVYFLIYDRKPSVRAVIFDGNGRMYIFEPEEITATEVKVRKSGAGQGVSD